MSPCERRAASGDNAADEGGSIGRRLAGVGGYIALSAGRRKDGRYDASPHWERRRCSGDAGDGERR